MAERCVSGEFGGSTWHATKSPTTATKTTPTAPAPTFAPFKLIPVGKAAEAAPAPADKK